MMLQPEHLRDREHEHREGDDAYRPGGAPRAAQALGLCLLERLTVQLHAISPRRVRAPVLRRGSPAQWRRCDAAPATAPSTPVRARLPTRGRWLSSWRT